MVGLRRRHVRPSLLPNAPDIWRRHSTLGNASPLKAQVKATYYELKPANLWAARMSFAKKKKKRENFFVFSF